MANAKLITQVAGAVHNIDQFPTVIKGLGDCKYFAYIFHDKDVLDKNVGVANPTYKATHLHFVAEDRMSLKNWAFKLGLPENMIEIVRSFRSCNRYLIHQDDTEKFLYNPSDVITNKPIRFKSYLENNDEYSPKDLFIDLSKLKNGGITAKDFLEKYQFYLNKQSFYAQFRIYQEIMKWSEY